ncbi:MAG: endolytic transglycosylase MltG, partial [Bosea sp. (in: a-proteobacteria)]
MSEQGDKEKAKGSWLGARRAGPKSPTEALKPSAAPPPPRVTKRRRRPFIALMSGLFTTALVLAGVLGIGVMVLSEQTRAPGPLASDKVVIIPKESGLGEITALLEREGVISHPWAFRIGAMTSGLWTRLKAGEYLFKANISAREALEVIEQGRAVLHSITIPEGLTSQQIIARLMENDILTGEVTQVPREGSLLPDTHKFQRGTSRQDLLTRMAQEQRRVLNEIWTRRSAEIPIRTPQELVILASIVEKETGRADERPRVAGVFINRINRKMKLQSDPTIVYGIVGGKG